MQVLERSWYVEIESNGFRGNDRWTQWLWYDEQAEESLRFEVHGLPKILLTSKLVEYVDALR